MLSLLDLLNHYLGFFNVNSKLKGRIYSVMALAGDSYIFYLATQYMMNKAYLRGGLILLAGLVILYFAVINIVYYFTEKTVKWDISPWLAKYMGNKPEEGSTGAQTVAFVPSNGVYAKGKVLPATVSADADMQAELKSVVEQLQAQHLMQEDYGQLSPEQQLKRLAGTDDVIYANEPGTPLPYYRLEDEHNGLAIYGGLNEMFAKRLGRITRVGLQKTADAQKEYDLYIATAVITGGPGHERGRSGLHTVVHPYTLKVELAYQKKSNNEHSDNK